MTLSSLPSPEVADHAKKNSPPAHSGIDYYARAACHRRTRTRRGPEWVSSEEMTLRDAILLAVKKFRIGEDSVVTSEGLSLYGIDAILAVRERPDFPELENFASVDTIAQETVINLEAQRLLRRRERAARRAMNPKTA